ncbi:Predicted dehydrogenase [Halobacillus karajensis]|uniref:1,5-anhydro-D-fructose reductase n=1 Tax=Halobacillus karajensis TaxID=195088 RepID=A0A024P3X7_9BACI|nr:Gfo/Idh/MocA family oxidoreductase [Halobacillus karajensis]CDQ19101.1 1,5-anhydro-D-fructose reductase [Halobacillus karajensis]CDQ22825.1 1,5-anhydro-D-fructose reductase [Halobacillus karajensis]CDQ26307.1 1,5-anhydro-D-fructose reductase [Halobacillus karajensis]SEH41565.1 Predicted dehydrogenase [Halobacillus karajensis]
MEPFKVGIVGCGNISDIYFKNSISYAAFDIVACADIDINRAKRKAELYHIPLALSVDELLDRPDIDLIINLTPPQSHADIIIESLLHDKHVYSEKPLAVSLDDGHKIINLAEERNLHVGAAPDTFLGAGIQTCLDVMQQGMIGTPVAGSAYMMKLGPERWHADPEFFYQEGGGPLFDMGPYYLTTLIQLLGPIRSVMAKAKIHPSERRIMKGPKEGNVIDVKTPTHYSGVLEFAKGPIVSMTMSFDVPATDMPFIEIYGSEGTLKVPDPNTFGGPVLVKKKGEEKWEEVQLTYPHTENSRGLGVVHMVDSIQKQTPFEADGQQALHVLEVMHAFHESSASGKQVLLLSADTPSSLLEWESK